MAAALKPIMLRVPLFKKLTKLPITKRTLQFSSSSSINNISNSSSSTASTNDGSHQTVRDVKKKLIDLIGIERGYQTVPKPRDHLLKYLPKSQEELPTRKMSDSFDSAIIPLSQNVDLQDRYITDLGHIRLGRLMEDLDLFAVWCTMNHLHGVKESSNVTQTPYNIVTVLVDQIDFTEFRAKPDADIRLSGHVCWVGKSSIEVVVWLEQESHGQWEKITRAIFLMAARNSINSGPALVNALEATTEEEKLILQGGEERKRRRQQVLKSSLLKTVPDQHETQLIHDLFVKTADPQDPTLHRRILPANWKWMKDCTVNNLVSCYPEHRNLHNKVFGGYLMRHALQISYIAAYLHSKHRPRLLHISDIGFHRPVDVGSMLQMHSHITYTQQNLMQVAVYADVRDPRSGTEATTNMFHYTYSAPEPVTSVIPMSYHEAMMYIDGRRHFQHVMMSRGSASA